MKYALDRSFEITGDWFLPEQPDRHIAGTLKYTPDRTELLLHESFRPLKAGPFHLDHMYPVVWGSTRDGEAMTLINPKCFGASMHVGSGGARFGERLITSLLIADGHVAANARFSSVSFRVPGLQIWHARQLIEVSHTVPNAPDGFAVSYRIPKPQPEQIRVESIAATVEFNISYSANMDLFSSIAATMSAWVIIRPDQPETVNWYLRQFGVLSTMLGFVAGSPMSTDCVEGSVGSNENKVSLLVNLRDQRYCTYKNLHDFFMTRATMGCELPAVIPRWFEGYWKVRTPSQLAASIFASEKLWLHVEFLSLMQGLEGFHRAVCEGTYVDDDKYETVKVLLNDAIPKDLSAAHKAALSSRIKYGNEFSLAKRLDDLADRLSEPIRVVIFGKGGRVPREWIDTRHYYTHWDEELSDKALDGRGMYEACVRLRVLLRILYLDVMGIPQAAIAKALVGASGSAQHLAQINAESGA